MNIAPSFAVNESSGTPAKRHVTTPVGVVLQGRRHAADVSRIHPRVAVGEDQQLMANEPHHREDVCNLGVSRAGDLADVDLDVPIGKRCRDTLRDR